MDASDVIRKRKAKAIYVDKKSKLIKAQPAADCNSIECTNYSTCIVTFSSYEEKLLFKEGRKLCKCAQQ